MVDLPENGGSGRIYRMKTVHFIVGSFRARSFNYLLAPDGLVLPTEQRAAPVAQVTALAEYPDHT